MRPGRSGRVAHGPLFVAAQIAEHDDVARRQRRDQNFGDIETE